MEVATKRLPLIMDIPLTAMSVSSRKSVITSEPRAIILTASNLKSNDIKITIKYESSQGKEGKEKMETSKKNK